MLMFEKYRGYKMKYMLIEYDDDYLIIQILELM